MATDPTKPGLAKTLDGDIHKGYDGVTGFIGAHPKTSLFIGLALLVGSFLLGHIL